MNMAYFFKSIIDHITSRTDIDTQKIFIMGTSFGCAVSLLCAHKFPDKVKKMKNIVYKQ